MKGLLFLSAVIVAGFGATSFAEECVTDECKANAERKSPANYDDGNAFDSGAVRNPASRGDSPYSEDEMQKNSPENFQN